MLWSHYAVVIGEILRWCWEASRYAAAGRRARRERRQAPVDTTYITYNANTYNLVYAPTFQVVNPEPGRPPALPEPPPGSGLPEVLRDIRRG
ncbi:hypothetical protein ABR738_12445 [Streptomyces sp. Edi4]|uniref:hypothetical protein n=1 Tax=Streptomyces sp. Edi4 TaxID=3162527 RepID=UPI003305E166